MRRPPGKSGRGLSQPPALSLNPWASDWDIDQLCEEMLLSAGMWFAAAKDAGLFEEALALAQRTPCDPKTLTRAARDHAEKQPSFALGAGLLSVYWLVQGYGYEITSADVWAAYTSTMKAAEKAGKTDETKESIRRMAASGQAGTNFVAPILGRELGLP